MPGNTNKSKRYMNDLQQWLNDPAHDYTAGVALFALYSPNKMLVRYFQTGTARFRMAKLVYEMGKLAKNKLPSSTGTQRTSFPIHKDESVAITAVQNKFPSILPQTIIPDFILAAKKEISSLYALIDKQHRELYDLGTSNEDTVVRKRKKILDGRKPSIERADLLYQLKEEWFSLADGTARERVSKEIKELLAAPVKEQPTIAETPGRASLPDVYKMSDIDLTKRLTQLRSSITKTRNMLQYQSIRKGNTPTPMPSGPKRDEYKRKLKLLQNELQEVAKELERRGKL